ncbi:MAG: tripartite tricarboxylate transporter TctB family protein [Rhodopseudomonas palustris]|nr:MAG: tripartite tricarboxylate transporter TctB family protein [Rhodopseudomonas palustris]
MGEDPREASGKSLWPRWIRGPQEFAGGLTLMAVAALALWAAHDLGGMRGFAPGAGTVPRLLAWMLLVLGGLVTAVGVFVEGPRMVRFAGRGLLFVGLAILAFAVAIKPLGLPLAAFLSFMIAALATKETRWGQTTLAGLCLAGVCSLLFPFVLRLPLPLLPRFLMP